MVALHHALEDSEDGQGRKVNEIYRDGHYYGTPGTAQKGHGKLAGKSKAYPATDATNKSKIAFSSPRGIAINDGDYDFNGNASDEIQVRDVSGEVEEGNEVARDNTVII